jgi:SAM-dependent methyltransferase
MAKTTNEHAKKFRDGKAIDREEIEALYEIKDVAENYDNERFSTYKGAVRNELDICAMLKMLPLNFSRVCDLAAGTGRFSEAILRNNKNIRLFSVDNSQEMLNVLQCKLSNVNNSESVVCRRINAFEMDFEDKFDVFVTFLFLQHFQKDDRFLIFEQIKKHLATRGVLIFDLPNEKYHKDLIKDRPVFDELYTEKKIKSELSACGFEVEEILAISSDSKLVRGIRKLPFGIKIKVYLIRLFSNRIFSGSYRESSIHKWIVKCRKQS